MPERHFSTILVTFKNGLTKEFRFDTDIPEQAEYARTLLRQDDQNITIYLPSFSPSGPNEEVTTRFIQIRKKDISFIEVERSTYNESIFGNRVV